MVSNFKRDQSFFELFYACDYTVFANYDHVRFNARHAAHNFLLSLRNCRFYGLCREACLKVHKDLLDGYCLLDDIKDKHVFYESMYISSYFMDDVESCKIALDNLPGVTEGGLNNYDFLWGKMKGDYAVLNFSGVEDRELVNFIAKKYKVIVYANVPVSKSSLCHNNIIIRPKNKQLPLDPSRIKLTMTVA